MSRINGTAAERFWPKVSRTGNCWLWLAATNKGGYGCFRDGGGRRMVLAHRWAYEALVGPISVGLQLDHLCRTPSCVNPAHLEPVTQRENLIRGIGFPGQNVRMTHCKNGHELSGTNLVQCRLPKQRLCAICRQAYMKSYNANRECLDHAGEMLARSAKNWEQNLFGNVL